MNLTSTLLYDFQSPAVEIIKILQLFQNIDILFCDRSIFLYPDCGEIWFLEFLKDSAYALRATDVLCETTPVKVIKMHFCTEKFRWDTGHAFLNKKYSEITGDSQSHGPPQCLNLILQRSKTQICEYLSSKSLFRIYVQNYFWYKL